MIYTETEAKAGNGHLPHAALGELTIPPSPAVVDLAALAALDGFHEPGEPDLVVELIGLFLEDAAQQMARIDEGAALRNAAEVQQAAHSLKGSSGSLGAHRVAAWCEELEMIDHHANWTGVPILIAKLKLACAEAVELLSAERDRRI